jgi:hypothetical protein
MALRSCTARWRRDGSVRLVSPAPLCRLALRRVCRRSAACAVEHCAHTSGLRVLASCLVSCASSATEPSALTPLSGARPDDARASDAAATAAGAFDVGLCVVCCMLLAAVTPWCVSASCVGDVACCPRATRCRRVGCASLHRRRGYGAVEYRCACCSSHDAC